VDRHLLGSRALSRSSGVRGALSRGRLLGSLAEWALVRSSELVGWRRSPADRVGHRRGDAPGSGSWARELVRTGQGDRRRAPHERPAGIAPSPGPSPDSIAISPEGMPGWPPPATGEPTRRPARAMRSSLAVLIATTSPATTPVCFDISWAEVDGEVLAGHIHIPPAGSPGPIVVTLFTRSFAGADAVNGCVQGGRREPDQGHRPGSRRVLGECAKSAGLPRRGGPRPARQVTMVGRGRAQPTPCASPREAGCGIRRTVGSIWPYHPMQTHGLCPEPL
jgi:hypothetical protein